MKSLTRCKLLLLVTLSALSLALSACHRPEAADSSSVRIQFPSASAWAAQKAVSQSVGTTIDYDKLCFAVQVYGDGLSSPTSGTCSWQKGIAVGHVPPGESMMIEVPMGNNRTFEVIGYLRNSASDACMPMAGELPPEVLSKTYFLGSTTGVDNFSAEMSVEIRITLPETTNTMASTENWPALCTAVTPPPTTTIPINLEDPRSANYLAKVSDGTVSVGTTYKAKSKILGLGSASRPTSTNYEAR